MATMVGVVIILLLRLLAPSPAAADVFCDNLKAVAAILPENTSSSPVHMGTVTFGQAPNTVYALALCRADILNNSACSDCVASAFQGVLSATPPEQEPCYKAGSSIYGDCSLVYSDHIIGPSDSTGGNDDDALYERWNTRNLTVDARDGPGIAGHIKDFLVRTAEGASSMAPIRFTTAVTDSIGSSAVPTMYSMAQCTPDLSAGDCLSCLHLLLDSVDPSMFLHLGGQMGITRCYFRYESYLFYYQQPPQILVGLLPPAPPPAPKHKGHVSKLWAIPIVVAPLAAAAVLCFIIYSRRLRKQTKDSGKVMTLQPSRSALDLEGEEHHVWRWKDSELSMFGFEQLREATNNFSEENKLGQGGFGPVYKGQLPEGLGIAVKRLSSHSGQGFTEFKNEVQFIAKLQHKNLVRLLGCCSQDLEKILVYEYLPNKSLDFFIFDENKRALLDWSSLLAIIKGIAHGLLYLHKHSRLRVIHRDLKPSNILLDGEMNPKISDFGLAKICSSTNIDGDTTKRVIGTFGYMAPEYASKGVFSVKSDVFSFGVVIFEILSGKRNSRNQKNGDFINLLGYAWQLWEDGRWSDLMYASLVIESDSKEMMRCIKIAFLCTQENASDRPTISDVVTMLSSETSIMPDPKKPSYFNARIGNEESTNTIETCSMNEMDMSITMPR